MNITTFFLAGVLLSLATAMSAAASNSDGILIKGRFARESEHVTKITRATVVCGDTQITAAEVLLDRGRNTMRCMGEATVRTGELTVKVRDLVIEIGNRKVFTLLPGPISMIPPATMSGIRGKPGVFQEATIPAFQAPVSLRQRD